MQLRPVLQTVIVLVVSGMRYHGLLMVLEIKPMDCLKALLMLSQGRSISQRWAAAPILLYSSAARTRVEMLRPPPKNANFCSCLRRTSIRLYRTSIKADEMVSALKVSQWDGVSSPRSLKRVCRAAVSPRSSNCSDLMVKHVNIPSALLLGTGYGRQKQVWKARCGEETRNPAAERI
jgi:hypothetical protein